MPALVQQIAGDSSQGRPMEQPTDREDEIRQIACYLWEGKGCQGGHALEHWLKAEVIWEQRQEDLANASQSL